MNSTEELMQLAHLMRVGAALLRNISVVQTADAQMIVLLADQTGSIADQLDVIARRAREGGALAH